MNFNLIIELLKRGSKLPIWKYVLFVLPSRNILFKHPRMKKYAFVFDILAITALSFLIAGIVL